MAISVEKWLVLAALGVISFLLGMIPYFIMKKVQQMRTNFLNHGAYHIILTILSCFGAGVLLTTAAMHMIPEVRDSLLENPDAWTNSNIDEHFPMAEVLMLSGLCLIYLIEEIAHFIMVNPGHGHSHHSHNAITRHSSMAHGIPVEIPGGPRSSLLNTSRASSPLGTHSGVTITLSADECCEENKNSSTGSGNSLVQKVDEDSGSNFGSMLRSFLALIALSFHAIVEGIAIGIQNSSSLWLMFGAIASHKFVISFCMGMELCASRAKLLTILSSILLFAVLSPVGIFIGSYLTSDDDPKTLGVVIIEGFAAGTLLYVVFFEILNRERERKSGVLKTYRFAGFVQFLSLTIGLVAMGYLLSLNEHDHGHSDEEDGHTHDDGHHHGHDHFGVTRSYEAIIS